MLNVFSVYSCKIRLLCLLMQDKTFQFSHAGWDFQFLLCMIRLSDCLMQDETFQFSHARWDVFSWRMRLFGFLMLMRSETFYPKHLKKTSRPLHYCSRSINLPFIMTLLSKRQTFGTFFQFLWPSQFSQYQF